MMRYKWDAVVLLILLLLILITYGISHNNQQGDLVTVTKDGEVLYTLPLSEDTELSIGENSSGQEYNLLIIKDGKADMLDANCPDRLCVHQKAISLKGQSIICLPHKLIISVQSAKEDPLDAITN